MSSRGAAASALEATPIRVLLIEDDEDDYVLTRALLAEIAEIPFEIEWFSTFDDAREALRRGTHDVCLLDYRLGEHSGIELLQEASASGYEVPIIVLTGQGNRDVDVEAMRAGAAYYLAKSGIDAHSLERTIRYALELRRAEQRARESEARVRAVLEHTVDGIITIDEQGVIESFNPAAARLFGYAPEEVIGANISMLMAEPYRSAHDHSLARYLQTGVATIIGSEREVLGRRKDGRSVPIELAVAEMQVGGRRTFIGSLRDITERKRSEAALRESERRLQLTVDAANIGLWDWDLAAQTVYYSPLWKRQLGYGDDELANTISLWAERLHPDDRQRATAKLEAYIREPDGSFEDEFRLCHRDGSFRWIHTRAVLVRDAAGRPARLVGAHVDITEWRNAEASVRQLNAELEERVADRTAQLEAANQELEAFSYSVSHDLRAPLRAIDGFASALVEECASALPDEGRHYLERVRSGSARMGRLIDDLLRLAQVTRAELRKVAVDLSALAHDIVAELRQKDPQRRVEVRIEPGLAVHGDPILLRQMLDNLLSNAWKYTGRHAEAHIELVSEERQGERVFVVRDDGAGFDPAYADKLFGTFQRLHAAGDFEGTGIGLATVKRIVHRHGGRVWAEGAIERGATFFFTL